MAHIQLVKSGPVPVQSVAPVVTESWGFTESASVVNAPSGTVVASVTASDGTTPIVGPHRIRRYDALGVSVDFKDVDASTHQATWTGIAAGVQYFYRLSPRLDRSILLNELGYNTPHALGQPTLTGPGTLNFKTQAARCFYNFNYADTAALKHASTGIFGSAQITGASGPFQFFNNTARITCDPTAGKAGGPAMVYDLFGQDDGFACGAAPSVDAFCSSIGVGGGHYWSLIRENFPSAWPNSGAGCTGNAIELKFHFMGKVFWLIQGNSGSRRLFASTSLTGGHNTGFYDLPADTGAYQLEVFQTDMRNSLEVFRYLQDGVVILDFQSTHADSTPTGGLVSIGTNHQNRLPDSGFLRTIDRYGYYSTRPAVEEFAGM